MRNTCRVVVLALCALTVSEAGEFPVNVRTAASQCNASVATYGDGSFIVVWSSYYSDVRGSVEA